MSKSSDSGTLEAKNLNFHFFLTAMLTSKITLLEFSAQFFNLICIIGLRKRSSSLNIVFKNKFLKSVQKAFH
ncbi:hypothetical protein EG359_09350 [Chryseobacterium joostei]|uniref:Uncharacterized protein n=1 Tax=Chryseobacterium joostei TaxID=112234 RepID=A0A1N7I3M5_9FLAO|nr:hypothetical protein EG359_09350 [Chryseobacterium joostei]SIS31669.1 hypothetical protein SAMN05421768_102517 [Chryseobacterium joostei]HCM33513.1 hypothetical protein [Chryseobacterium sp.]